MSWASVAGQSCGRAAGLACDDLSQRLLAGSGIDQNAAAALDKSLGDSGIALHRPALGAPAGAGVDEYGVLAGRWRQDFVGPGLGGRVYGQPWSDGGKFIAGDGRGQLHVLLDDVNAMGGHALRKKPARRPLARFGLANQPAATGQARHHRRADGPLQVDDGVVFAGLERCA